MWASRYWARRFWGGRYWAPKGLTAFGHYWAATYWSGNYWARSYWDKATDSNPEVETVSGGITLAGVLGVSDITPILTYGVVATVSRGIALSGVVNINGGTPIIESTTAVVAGAPLLLSFTGSLGLSGVTPIVGTGQVGGGYWANRYWAHRFWLRSYWAKLNPWVATVTSGVSISGVMTASGVPAQVLRPLTASTLTMSGALGVSGVTPIVVTAPAPQEAFGGYWPDYGRPRRKKRKPEEVEDAVEVVKPPVKPAVKPPLSLPKRPLKLDALLGPDKPAVAKETPEQIEARIKKAAEERKKRKRRKLEDDLLLM